MLLTHFKWSIDRLSPASKSIQHLDLLSPLNGGKLQAGKSTGVHASNHVQLKAANITSQTNISGFGKTNFSAHPQSSPRYGSTLYIKHRNALLLSFKGQVAISFFN